MSTRFSPSMEISRLKLDGTAEPVSRDQILRRKRGQENIHFPCSADHEQDWQPYPVDPYSYYMCDHTYIASICGMKFNRAFLGGFPAVFLQRFFPITGGCSEGLGAF